ncbi:MAG: hypothetical protein R3F49_04235 [Planctomycetota bacterium]
MTFEPPACPNPDPCPSQSGEVPFACRPAGWFSRKCDGLIVQRFRCCVCGKRFSEQTFKATYRQKRPELNEPCFRLFVAKVTMRQASRTLLCNRKSIRRRMLLLGDIGEATHGHFAPKRDEARFMAGTFLLDELETYATSRRNNPLTVPVLIHGESFFVVHTEVGLLPRRGGLGRDEAAPDPLSEAEDEARRLGSKAAVRACFERLQEVTPPTGAVRIATDCKATYPVLVREAFGERVEHTETLSTVPRGTDNPLFKINHTFALMRDGISRLVRETWAASKRAGWLKRHLWIWISYRNYVRGVTNAERHVTPAMKIGAADRQLTVPELILWRPRWVPALIGA